MQVTRKQSIKPPKSSIICEKHFELHLHVNYVGMAQDCRKTFFQRASSSTTASTLEGKVHRIQPRTLEKRPRPTKC